MGKLQGWMEIVYVVDECLEISQGRKSCSDYVVYVSFDETKKGAIIRVIDKFAGQVYYT